MTGWLEAAASPASAWTGGPKLPPLSLETNTWVAPPVWARYAIAPVPSRAIAIPPSDTTPAAGPAIVWAGRTAGCWAAALPAPASEARTATASATQPAVRCPSLALTRIERLRTPKVAAPEVVSERRTCGWRAPDRVRRGRRTDGIAALFRGPRTKHHDDPPPPDGRGGF